MCLTKIDQEVIFDKDAMCVCVCKMDSSSWRALDFDEVQIDNSSSMAVSLKYEPWCDLTCYLV
jgi:translation elongation factor EF-1alpha